MHAMTPTFQPYRESWRRTLTRTIAIALVVGGVLAWRFHAMRAWSVMSLLVLWFSLGGHWVELWFLNWLRPRLAPGRAVQLLARLGTWFAGGIGLGAGITWTTARFAVTRGLPTASWWGAGLAFVGVELVAHAVLAARRHPSFYDGTG